MSTRSRVAELAATTPAERIRSIDFLRAVSIMLVMLGHWLVIAIVVRADRIEGRSVLAVLPWTHPLTWLFQVMPLFFMVGGFANAKSWESEREQGPARWVPWVLRRTERFLRPTTIFLAIGLATVVLASAAGVRPGLIEEAGWLVNIALWFLAVYVGIAAAAPFMLALHERWGIRAFAGLISGVALVDVARVGLGVPFVGLANFGLGWLALHQLGLLLRDGTLTRRRLVPPAMAVGGLLALVTLTALGPYPVSMVNVPGAALQNTAPPTAALVALGLAQAGLVLSVRPGVDRWLERPRVWLAVVSVNAIVLTIYLWHLVPVIIVALVQRETGWLPEPEIGSGAWWAVRALWVGILALILVPLVAAAGRFERSGRKWAPASEAGRGYPTAILAALGVLMASGGLALFTLDGLHGDGPLGLPLPALTLYASALVLLRIARTIVTGTRSTSVR
jgi:fucose 4-O-acetylase-like acetyltransferase